MSRLIEGKARQSAQDSDWHNTKGGKLIFTTYQDKPFAFLIRDNRLIAAQELPKDNVIGAIYIGKIRNVVRSIHAYFVEIGDGDICFLPMKETDPANPLKEGDELPVQIIREAQKTKQATVTARISLSNAYVAISLGKKKVGYSNKLSATKKQELATWLQEAKLVDEKGDFTFSFGAVIRTQAEGLEKEVFLEQITNLAEKFANLLEAAQYRSCFSCIQKGADCYEKIFDQLLYPDEFDEILTDETDQLQALKHFCADKMPQKRLRFYDDPQFSLAKLYALQTKMELALDRRVWLKSGGYLVIDPTEALTVIDVNSGKFDKKRTPDETAWLTNKEAVSEIAMQLRLRNLSGIIIVDFINMTNPEQKENLLAELKKRVHDDKLKTIVHDMTSLGLVEITRKKQYRTLREQINDKRMQRNGI